jgi:hypothetical protein
MRSFSWIMAYNIAVCVDDCCYLWKGLLRCFDNRRVDNLRRKVYAVVKIIKNGIDLFN